MQYNANTPTEYLDVLEEDWRKEQLLQIREIILLKAYDFKERINYKMLCYTDENFIKWKSNKGIFRKNRIHDYSYSIHFLVRNMIYLF